jgi:hypothetical protein
MLVWRELCSEGDNSARPPTKGMWYWYLAGGRKLDFVSRPESNVSMVLNGKVVGGGNVGGY